MSDYNTHVIFLWKITRAASEYIVHLSTTPGAVDFDLNDDYIDSIESNIDLAWLVHFLRDFAFLVRANQSKKLDVLWREFFALGHTSTTPHFFCAGCIGVCV